MANQIESFKNYAPLLDEAFMNAALTGALESDASVARMGANANEIIIPKMSMDGLADYDRDEGYMKGSVKLTTQTKAFNYERGRMFSVDAMDNEETAGVAFGMLAGEFIRTQAAPEADAVRFALYAGKAGNASDAAVHYTDGEAVLKALRRAITAMDEAQVPQDQRYLFITPTLDGMIMDLDTTKSREALSRFAGKALVPQSRFFSNVTLLSGGEEEEKGGYAPTAGAGLLNFLIVQKSAVMQFTKHAAPKVIPPEQNQNADAWKFGYRVYGLFDVYDNKRDGVFVSKSTVAA